MNSITANNSKKSSNYLVDTVAIITHKIKETPDTHTLRLKTPNLNFDQIPFQFKPGQFVMVRPFIEEQNKVIPRAYSISSSPTRSVDENGYFDLTIRQTETPTVSKWLNDRKVGDEIPFRGPYGDFIWNKDDPRQEEVFMLAGGSGITPMKSILEFIHDKKLENKVELFYSCRQQEDIIFEDELPKLAANCNDAKLNITLTREPPDSEWTGFRGRFNLDDIKQSLWDRKFDINKTGFFLCGTPQFVTGMIDILIKIGVNPECIKKEKWD